MKYTVELDVYFNVVMDISENLSMSRSESFEFFDDNVYYDIRSSNDEKYDFDIIDEYTKIDNSEAYPEDIASGKPIKDYVFNVKVKVRYPVEANTDKEAIDKAYELFYDSHTDVKVTEDRDDLTFHVKDIGYGDVWFCGLPQ